MPTRRKLAILLVICCCLIVSACATTSAQDDIDSGFQSGTHILGLVARIHSRDEILQNKNPVLTAEWKKYLLAAGLPESDIVDGSEVDVFTYCYAHNSSVGCKHVRGYTAHASPDVRNDIKKNSVVAIKVDVSAEKWLIGSVMRVYGLFDDPALDCEFLFLNYKGLSSFSPYGPPIAKWFECRGIKDDGWVRECAPEAPPGGPFNDNRCVFESQKPPPNK